MCGVCGGKMWPPSPCRKACGSDPDPWEHLHYICRRCGRHVVTAREMVN